MTIGERIRQARKTKGLTQKQLGELSNTSEGTVRQYERGVRQPRLEQLQRIAAALDVSVNFFLPPDEWVGNTLSLTVSTEELKSYVKQHTRNRADLRVDVAMEHPPEDVQEEVRQLNFNATPDPEWVELDAKLKNGTITQDELRRLMDLESIAREGVHSAVEDAKLRLQKIIEQLNEKGQLKVADYADDILPRYRRQEPQEPLACPQEGKDTTPPPEGTERPTGGSETPQEGE